MSELISSLEAKRVVPLVQSDDTKTALKISEALLEGGLDVLEVVLRTDAALDCLEAIAKEFPKAHVGAGTVLSADQSKDVIQRGASFIVSPGLDEASVKVANDAGLPILPGISTATELQQAWNMGLRTVKLFPASLVAFYLSAKSCFACAPMGMSAFSNHPLLRPHLAAAKPTLRFRFQITA